MNFIMNFLKYLKREKEDINIDIVKEWLLV